MFNFGPMQMTKDDRWTHYHIGDRGVACVGGEGCSDPKRCYANPDTQRICDVCGLLKWRREEFNILTSNCKTCQSAACARGDHAIDFDCIGPGVVTKFSCCYCDWRSDDPEEGFGKLGFKKVE